MNETATLLNDAAALHDAYAAGTWQPTPGEAALAADLARAQWSGSTLCAALRRDDIGHGAGGLAGVLATAAAVLEEPDAERRPDVADALRQMRQLVDLMADV